MHPLESLCPLCFLSVHETHLSSTKCRQQPPAYSTHPSPSLPLLKPFSSSSFKGTVHGFIVPSYSFNNLIQQYLCPYNLKNHITHLKKKY